MFDVGADLILSLYKGRIYFLVHFDESVFCFVFICIIICKFFTTFRITSLKHIKMAGKKKGMNFIYGLVAGIILYKVIFDFLIPMF